MMLDLLRAEILRLRYRRRSTWSVLLMLVVGLVLPTQWMPGAAPLTAQEYRDAKLFMAQEIEEGYCEPSGCRLDDFLRTVMDFDGVVTNIAGSGLLVAFIVFMIVLTYVASDFASGALATQLTFTPRRPAVLAARTLGAALLGGTLMAVETLTNVAVSTIWYLALHGFGSVGGGAGLLDTLASAVAYGLILGAVASLLVFILGSALLAAGAAVLTLVVNFAIEAYVTGSVAVALSRLFPLRQAEALLTGEAPVGDSYWTSWETAASSIHRPEAIGYHVIVIGVLLVLAIGVFRRHDIRT